MKPRNSILCFSLVSVVLLCYNAHPENDNPFAKIGIQMAKDGMMAPNFCLKSLNGKELELKDFGGKVVFVNFWATWCGPCIEEMPSMEALYREYKERGFVFLAVSVDYGGMTPVKRFVADHRYTFPVLLDPDCKTLDLYRVKGIPTTLIIDRKGQCVGRAIGPRNWESGEAKSMLTLLLPK